MIGSPTTAQLQNVSIVNRLSEFGAGLAALCSQQLSVLGQDRVDTLLKAGQQVDAQMKVGKTPFLACEHSLG